MFKFFDKDIKLTVFALGIFLYMCISNDLCITFLIPNSLRYLGGLLIPLVCAYYTNIKKFDVPCFFIILFFLYYFIIHPSLWGFLDALVMIVSSISIIAMSSEKKVVLLDLLKSYLTIIILVSIVGWVLFLVGVNLPYENIEVNDFHDNVNNYYLFSMDADFYSQVFPRFSGMFLEPGQMATPCVLFIFADGGSLKDKRNLVLLVAILISFSLVAYIMLAIGYSIRSIIINRRHIFIKVLVPVCIVVGVGFVMFQEANDDNPIYAMILSRLEGDEEKGFVGNNRTNDYVDSRFEQFIKSSNRWVGLGPELAKDNWTSGSSGYKVFLLNNGLLGLIFLSFLVFFLYNVNKSRYNRLLLLLVILAFIPRSMVTKAMWFFPIILGFYLNCKQVRIYKIMINGQKQYTKQYIKTSTELI